MSEPKCTGACCKHVADKLTGMIIPSPEDVRFDAYEKKISNSENSARLYQELMTVHSQYATDVARLIFEVQIAGVKTDDVDFQSGESGSEVDRFLAYVDSDFENAEPTDEIKSAVKEVVPADFWSRLIAAQNQETPENRLAVLA